MSNKGLGEKVLVMVFGFGLLLDCVLRIIVL